MTPPRRVAVTGAGGRLGRAVADELAARGATVLRWSRPDYDLDEPRAARRLVERDRPELVIGCAAWTDVDGCARDPELALRRNGTAVAELAGACGAAGADLVLVSTNEVFDGERSDGRGYREDDPPRPRNPYGASKLAGERAARAAYDAAGAPERLWIVRTAWLFGPPGNDFPARIVAAADRLAAGERLPVVADEFGSPTFTRDLAPALLDLAAVGAGGCFHLVNAGAASRLEYATAVLAACRPGTLPRPIGREAYRRASSPPPWSVLDGSRAAARGVALRPWREALATYLAEGCPG